MGRLIILEAMFFAMMIFGAFSESHILKGIGAVSAAMVLLSVVPFSWWLNGAFRR
jgi:hypothetical protein